MSRYGFQRTRGWYLVLPGFWPINAYAWKFFGWAGKLDMLFRHARFIPYVIIQTYTVWRMNRTAGPRWRYPWEKR